MSVPEENLVVVPSKKQKNNYQPNLITESRQMFTALEKNIVVMVINQLTIRYFEKSQPLFPNQNVDFLIPFSEISKSRNYSEIERAAKSLQLKQQGFAYTNDKGERYFKYMIPFPLVENLMSKGKMCLKITMFSGAVPYYTELGKTWTSYDYEVMRSLGSLYSKRVYEILMSHYRNNDFTYEVDHLRHILNVPDTFKYFDFTRKCLDVANNEIKAKTGMEFTYQPVKKEGKKVTKLKFTKISPLSQVESEVEKNRQYISNMPVGEAVALAWKWFSNYTFNNAQKSAITDNSDKLDTFLRIHSEVASGRRKNVKNATAYMVKSLSLENVRDKKKEVVPKTTIPRSTASPKALSSIIGTMNLFKPEE
ncbi:RepB family plasmid replication initiator protein [Spirosoma aerophilum]